MCPLLYSNDVLDRAIVRIAWHRGHNLYAVTHANDRAGRRYPRQIPIIKACPSAKAAAGSLERDSGYQDGGELINWHMRSISWLTDAMTRDVKDSRVERSDFMSFHPAVFPRAHWDGKSSAFIEPSLHGARRIDFIEQRHEGHEHRIDTMGCLQQPICCPEQLA
jgi:hypothetical protein